MLAVMSFCRYEKKFLVSSDVAERFVEKISPYVTPDPYCIDGREYEISNIYFDTENSDVIRRSLSKPRYKEKLRIRSYGVPNFESKTFIELKKKINGLTLKRRATLKLGEAYSYLEKSERPDGLKYINSQVLNEVDWYLSQNKVSPAVYIAYDRSAFFAHDNDSVRITLDRNIRTRRKDLRLELGDYGEPLLENWVNYAGLQVKDPRLIEIKVSTSFPLWLVDALSSEKMRMSSFSKYGNEYRMFCDDFENFTKKEYSLK